MGLSHLSILTNHDWAMTFVGLLDSTDSQAGFEIENYSRPCVNRLRAPSNCPIRLCTTWQSQYSIAQLAKRMDRFRGISHMKSSVIFTILLVVSVTAIVGILSALGEVNHSFSAGEDDLACPESLVGLTLIQDELTEIHQNGNRLEFECKYALDPSPTVLASLRVTWTEKESDEVLVVGCRFPPTLNPGFFSASGSFYGIEGQSRVSYEGRGRFDFAMQNLASQLAAKAGSVSAPCPGIEPVSIPGSPIPRVQFAPGEPDFFSQPSVSSSTNPIGVPEFDESPEGKAVIGTITAGRSQFGPEFDSSDQGKTAIATLTAGRARVRSQAERSNENATAIATLTAGRAEFGAEFDDSIEGRAAIATVEANRARSGSEFDDTIIAGADVATGFCIVRGRVTDSRGAGVPLISLSIHDSSGTVLELASTDSSGNFGFSKPVETNRRLTLTPTDYGRPQPLFQVFAEQSVVTLNRNLSNVVRNGICEVNFDVWNLDSNFTAQNPDRWPSIIELYQNFNQAAQLATDLGAPFDYGLPLPIYAWCTSAALFCDPSGQAEFAFYSGTTTGRTVPRPYIAFGFPTSEIDYRGVPDNREYHEFGHAFIADMLNNEIPLNVGDNNHGGYYRNERTTDSMIEGLAEFYSVMVSKHVDEEQNPQRYRIGAEYDIETDRKAWESIGWWEEFTLAGLLLDFEDGHQDYAQPANELSVEIVTSLKSTTGNFAIGRLRNNAASVARNPEVTVTLLDGAGNTVFSQVTTVIPGSLGPDQTGMFYVAAPGGVEFSDVVAIAGRPASTDDDDIDLELSELMRILTSNWGSESQRITTVQDLYSTLSRALSGRDLDDDGTTDITQQAIDAIFINHGFFDDLDGDNRWSPSTDGDIGGTSHPGATIGNVEFSGISPRSSAVGFVGSFVDIDAAGTEADLLVQVENGEARESYAYWTNGGTMGDVELAVPGASANEGAVTVIAVAEGHLPAVAYRTRSEDFHAAVDSGEITNEPVTARVELETGDLIALLNSASAGGATGGGDVPLWLVMIPVLLAGVMLGGGYYYMRRVPVLETPSSAETDTDDRTDPDENEETDDK